MKFAFIIMGPFDGQKDRAQLKDGNARIIGVGSLNQACEVAKELQSEGVSCIELCGAFGEAGTRKLIEATGNKVPIGYVTHLPEQEDLFIATFGK